MLFLVIYSVFSTLARTGCLADGPRVYRLHMFDGDRNGRVSSHPITGSINSSHVSIRFVSENDPGDVFWLQLANKAVSTPLPVMVKTGRSVLPMPSPHSRDNTTSTGVASCLYVANGALTRAPSGQSSRQDPGHSLLHFETPKSLTERSQSGPSQPELQYQAMSFFTISLCHGIRGIVQLDNSSSYVLIHGEHKSDLATLQVLPYPSTMESSTSPDALEQHLISLANDSASQYRLKRSKRSSFHMPVGRMPGPFLVELYVIVDSKMASLNRYDNYRSLLSRITAVMNQINMAFSQFNIYFTVVQLEIWEYDQIKLTDENHIIMELQLYKRRFVTKRHDCLHAILGENLGSSRRGQAEQASMCGYNSCVGYTKDYSGQDELKISHSMLHEIGHNFGLSHDNEQCQCYGCIMATGVEFMSATLEWSNCSRRQIDSLLKSGMADCLRDRPVSALGGLHPVVKEPNNEQPGPDISFNPICGNGVVDDGEQCDCGGSSRCRAESNRCCNPVTCRLSSNATCAGGACCDMQRCSLRARGVVCRVPGSESCDLPEYCDGTSEWCPRDVYKQDGTVCRPAVSREYSLCYRGACHSRYSRCQLLWGDTGVEASDDCFQMNEDGGPVKNCGIEIPHRSERDRQPRNWYNKRCSSTNTRCGRLWCSHENERVLRPSSHVLVDQMLGSQHCSAVRFDMDWFFDDPGMVPNGADCGSGKVCWHSQCVPASTVNTADSSCYCHGHGVCNNLGHCHCDGGFAPPNCTTPGDGGSLDSGPPAPFLVNVRTVIAGVIICLIIILTGLLLAAFIYHYRHHDWPFFLSTIKCLNYKKGQFEGHGPGNGVRTIQYHSPGARPANRLVLVVDPNRDSDKTGQGLLQSPGSPTSPTVLVLSSSDRYTRSPSDRPAIVHPKPKPEPLNNGTVTKLGKTPAGPIKKPEAKKVSKGDGETRPVILCDKPRKQPGQPTAPPVTLKKPGPKAVQKPALPSRDVPEPASQTSRQLAKDAVSKVLVGASSKQPTVREAPQTRTGGPGTLGGSGRTKQATPAATVTTSASTATARTAPDKPVTKALISRPRLDQSSKEPPPTKISPRPAGPSPVTKVTASDKLPPILCSKPAQKAPSAVSSVSDATNRREPHSVPVTSGPKVHQPMVSNLKGTQPMVSGPKEVQPIASGPKEPQPMVSGPRFQAAQISQPRLDRTTCTDATRDLPRTDKTLTRQVASHKILEVDPRSATKYL